MASLNSSRLTVLVADDQPTQVYRTHIQHFLQSAENADIEVVGVASTGKQAVQLARQTLPDVVVLTHTWGVMMTGGLAPSTLFGTPRADIDAPTAASLITAELPNTRIILLVEPGLAEMLANSHRAGNAEVLLIPRRFDDLVGPVVASLRGIPKQDIINNSLARQHNTLIDTSQSEVTRNTDKQVNVLDRHPQTKSDALDQFFDALFTLPLLVSIPISVVGGYLLWKLGSGLLDLLFFSLDAGARVPMRAIIVGGGLFLCGVLTWLVVVVGAFKQARLKWLGRA